MQSSRGLQRRKLHNRISLTIGVLVRPKGEGKIVLHMRIAALAALLTGFLTLQAQTEPKPLRIPIEQYKLDNGLRVVMSVDHSAPTYGISITYNVGSHNEHAGRTGFAHLFEHMMFEGSENVGKGEHMILVENNGGN